MTAEHEASGSSVSLRMGDDDQTPPSRARRLRVPPAVSQSVAVALVALVAITAVLQLWRADLSVPFSFSPDERSTEVYPADAPFYLMLVQGLIDHDTYLTNPSLGAPAGQQLYDVPSGNDNFQFGVLWVIGKATGNAPLTVNLYYLLTYPLVAVATFLVARRLGLRPLIAAAVALLYTFAPYHLARGTSHLLLSGYYFVPFGFLLVLRVMGDDPPFTAEAGNRGGWRLRLRAWPTLGWLVVCAGLASTGAYYAMFTVVLLLGVAVIDVVARRRWRGAVAAGVAVGTIALVAAVNLAPSFLYWRDHGGSTNLIARFAAETEKDGLKVSQLFLPIKGHRLAPLAAIQRESQKASPVRSERGQQLGIIGAVGLVGLVVVSLASVLGYRHRARGSVLDPDSDDGSILRRAGVVALLSILYGTISGLSLLFAGLGLRQFRSWNRISLFIGLAALVAVGLVLERAWRALAARGVPRFVPATGVVLLALAGVVDQTTLRNVPDYAARSAQWESDEAFVDQIVDQLGPGAMVYQLPYVYFPEAGQVHDQGPYDAVRGYLHGPELRWSYGDTRLRHPEWQLYYRDRPIDEQLDAYAAVGFDGLWLGAAGYPDRGTEAAATISTQLGQQPQVSADGSLLFWDLRPRRAALVAELGEQGLADRRAAVLAQDAAPPPDEVFEEF